CMEQSDWWPAPVGAHSVRNALALVACKGKSLRLPSAAELLSLCVAKEKDNQRERPPRLALAGHPARQVREPGPGFSTGHPALAKRSRHPCRLPLRGLSSPTHRRTGAPGRAARHRGAHSVRNRCAVAKCNAMNIRIEGDVCYRPRADIASAANTGFKPHREAAPAWLKTLRSVLGDELLCLVRINVSNNGALLPSNPGLGSHIRKGILSRYCRFEAESQSPIGGVVRLFRKGDMADSVRT